MPAGHSGHGRSRGVQVSSVKGRVRSGQVKKQQQGKTPTEVKGQGEEGSGCERVIQS